MSEPEIDVITPVYVHNDELMALTTECFASVYRVNQNIRIICVDNGSPAPYCDDIQTWLAGQKRPYLYYRMPGNLGFVKGTNMGLSASTAPHIVFQNNDTLVYTDIYERMQKACQIPEVGVVGVVSSAGWQDIRRLVQRFPAWRNLHMEAMSDEKLANTLFNRFKGQIWPVPRDHGMVAFFCVMLRREVIARQGYLLEEWGMGLGDDNDYCHQIAKAGFGAYLALDCYCWHKLRTTWLSYMDQDEVHDLQRVAMDRLREKRAM